MFFERYGKLSNWLNYVFHSPLSKQSVGQIKNMVRMIYHKMFTFDKGQEVGLKWSLMHMFYIEFLYKNHLLSVVRPAGQVSN